MDTMQNQVNLPDRSCAFCEQNFTPWSARQRFCTYDCRGRYWAQQNRIKKAAEREARLAAAEAAAATQ